ncbi:MAG: FapA family protein [candidate division FCPU426 bacterium]
MSAIHGYCQVNTADDGLIITVHPPVQGGKKATLEEVKAQIEALGFKGVKWEDVKRAVEAATAKPVVIMPPKPKTADSQIFVEVGEGEMTASVTILPPERGGSVAHMDRIKAALAANGVVYGIDEAELASLETQASAMTDPNKVYSPVEAVIAKGKPVVHGVDAYLEKYYEKKKEEPAPKTPDQVENKNARVDYREMNVIDNVEKGSALAKKIPMTMGEKGITVTGHEIVPDEAKDLEVKAGQGAAIDPHDPMAFVATETGQVTFKDGVLSVLAIYEINGDLTMKIGNVDFMGTVLIHGSINGEFKVKAGADVVIDGVLDGGEVIAGGNVTIKGGVIGAKTRVTAEGEINAKYIRNAYVESGSIISIQDTSMHSTLIASDKVMLTGRGHLVGGTTVAGWEVLAREIGARSNTPTEIEVGEDPRLRDEMKRIEAETKTLNEQLDKAKKGITFLKDLSAKLQGKLPDDKKELLGKLTRTQFKLLGDLKGVQAREAAIKLKESDTKSKRRAKISCNGMIYPGTKVTISHVSKAMTQETKFCTLVEHNGEIKSNPYG